MLPLESTSRPPHLQICALLHGTDGYSMAGGVNVLQAHGIVVSYCTAPIPLSTSELLFMFGPLTRRHSCHQVEGLRLSAVPMTS